MFKALVDKSDSALVTKFAYLKELILNPKVLDRILTGFHLITKNKKELNKLRKLNTGSRASLPMHTCKV